MSVTVSVDLSQQMLDAVPAHLLCRKTLTHVNLESNRLSSWPDFSHSEELCVLSLSWNKLSMVPAVVGLLHTLTHLNLSFNQLNSVDSAIGVQTQLTHVLHPRLD